MARSPTSSTRRCGRRSTSPTSRSPSGVVVLAASPGVRGRRRGEPRRRREPAAPRVVFTRRAARGGRQARGAGRSPGSGGPRDRRSSTCSASCSAAARTRAPRDRPPARQGHLRADARRPRRGGPPATLGDDQGARGRARTYLALIEGRPRSRAGTIDAPLGRDHRAPERRAVRGRGAREARTHFEVARGAAGRHPGRGPARDRPHAPDPRPLRRDRPPGRRRPALRARRPPRPRAPVPAQRPARASRTRSSGERLSFESRAARLTSRRRSSALAASLATRRRL